MSTDASDPSPSGSNATSDCCCSGSAVSAAPMIALRGGNNIHTNDDVNNALPSSHFLSLPRPDVHMGRPAGVVDTTTLAAHDFDVDARTGFMPPQPPLARLPSQWEQWEDVLDDAVNSRLSLGDTPNLEEEKFAQSERWRNVVRDLPIIPTDDLKESEILLRRGHCVLAWIMHFYINTLPSTAALLVPKPISIPLLQISTLLDLPPLLTYSDDVLYNWEYLNPPSPPPSPTTSSFSASSSPSTPPPLQDPSFLPVPTSTTELACITTFTSTPSESHFYLTSARIELRGVHALALMRATMDEAFVRDALALRRIAAYLHSLALVIDTLTAELLRVRDGCDPLVFYDAIRPWFKGQDSMPGARKWVFEGVGEDGAVERWGECMRVPPRELSGPSAGQSALLHALDLFLGVDVHAPMTAAMTESTASGSAVIGEGMGRGHEEHVTNPTDRDGRSSFDLLKRMQSYMPRHHRAFLRHLAANPRPLRKLVEEETSVTDIDNRTISSGVKNAELLKGYNAAVTALKGFRDAHLRIVALYIVGPSRRVAAGSSARKGGKGKDKVVMDEGSGEKGTGGTHLMPFLKSIRDRTAQAVIQQDSRSSHGL